jgi:hypothetical protein
MLYRLSFALVTVGCLSTAHAEPVSLRCSDDVNKTAYFLTYDVSTGRSVFESPAGVASAGEASADGDRIALSLHAANGNILIYFEPRDARIRWPGFLSGELRDTLLHTCAAVPPRTILSMVSRYNKPSINGQASQSTFSLQCPGYGQLRYFSLDPVTKNAALETEGPGRVIAGTVTSATDTETRFTLEYASDVRIDFVWDSPKKTLTTVGVAGDVRRPTKTDECDVIAARSIMELYGRLVQAGR